MSTDEPSVERFKRAFKGKSPVTSGQQGADLLTAAKTGGQKTSVIRKAAMKFAKSQPEMLEKLTEKEEGRTLLTQIVKDLGSAKTDEEKQFVQQAIKVQYNIDTLEGHLTTKALPRLFLTLAKVPEWQVRGNEKVVKIKRFKAEDPLDEDSKKRSVSWYKAANEDDGTPATIVLNLGRTSETENYYPDGKKTKVNSFDITTLHEIGHAVDDQLGYMKKMMGKDEFGKWKELTEKDIVRDVVGGKFGFFDKYEQIPRACLDMLIDEVLGKGQIQKPQNWDMMKNAMSTQSPEAWSTDPGVVYAESKRVEYEANGWPAVDVVAAERSQAITRVKINGMLRLVYEGLMNLIMNDRVPLADAIERVFGEVGAEGPDWDEMKKEPALKWLLKVRMTGSDDGLWDGGDKAANEALIDGTWVYQQAYSSKWYRYDVGTRATRVTNYQFRAPGEWFAELYALYYIGKLPANHSARTWLERDIDVDVKPDPSSFT